MNMAPYQLVGNVPVFQDWLYMSSSFCLATLPRWRIISLEIPTFTGAFLFWVCFLFVLFCLFVCFFLGGCLFVCCWYFGVLLLFLCVLGGLFLFFGGCFCFVLFLLLFVCFFVFVLGGGGGVLPDGAVQLMDGELRCHAGG